MFRNYLKSSLRNLLRNKLYTLLNIFGLALGLALCLVVVGHMSHEYSFEDCHQNKDRIYRLQTEMDLDGQMVTYATSVALFGQAVDDEIPEVAATAIFRKLSEISVNTFDNDYYPAGNMIIANPDFLNVFTFPLRQGNPETVLDNPLSVVISEKAARKYFSTQNPIGQQLRLNDRFNCTVTGVMQDVPTNTQLHCDFIVSHSSLDRVGEDTRSWEPYGTDYVYLLLNADADPSAVKRKLGAILQRNVAADKAEKAVAYMKPLKDIYFGSWGHNLVGELSPRGEASFIFEMGLIASFILIMALINFINLSTARTAGRHKEVGVRKVFGARRLNLVKQFLGESFILTLMAMLVSVVLYEVFKRSVTDMLPRQMFVDFYDSPMMMLMILALIAVVGILAGFYPAFYLSRFRPIAVLQKTASIKSSRSLLRRILVLLQFAVALFFVTDAVILYRQVNHVTNMNLGFDRDNILVLDFEGDDAAAKCAVVKQEVLSSCPVVSATASNCPPGRTSYTYYGLVTDADDTLLFTRYWADPEFFTTFGLEVVKGQALTEQSASEFNNPVVITESVAKRLGPGDPVGQHLRRRDGAYEIVGVVKDFYGGALDVGDLDASMAAISLDPQKYSTLSIKLADENLSTGLASVEKVWDRTMSGAPFRYVFLDDEIYRSTADYRGMRAMFMTLGLFSIVIACLGIFGLVSFTAEQRSKEIGIRKVLGAEVAAIVTLLSREFLILLAIAGAIAWPLSYLMMSDILGSFSVRVGLGPGTFLFAGLLTLVFALVTAGSQAFRAAIADPVTTLRRE